MTAPSLDAAKAQGAVFAYGNAQNASGRFWEETRSKFPDDIARLKALIAEVEKKHG